MSKETEIVPTEMKLFKSSPKGKSLRVILPEEFVTALKLEPDTKVVWMIADTNYGYAPILITKQQYIDKLYSKDGIKPIK